jgi:hypothetical protein
MKCPLFRCTSAETRVSAIHEPAGLSSRPSENQMKPDPCAASNNPIVTLSFQSQFGTPELLRDREEFEKTVGRFETDISGDRWNFK